MSSIIAEISENTSKAISAENEKTIELNAIWVK
jgi:hypothetical protein